MIEEGKFIVFEGLNGCGKGTQITKFQHYLRGLGKAVPVFITGEPNETFDKFWGKRAREMLKMDGDPYKNQLEALNCFSENRRIHNTVFNHLLEKGVHVISDRYYHSTFAFQHAQGISYEDIANANRSEDIRIPDLTFILDIPPEIALERRVRRGELLRKFERDLEFNKQVRINYLELENVLPGLIGDESVVYVNGEPSPRDVFQEIVQFYEKRFG